MKDKDTFLLENAYDIIMRESFDWDSLKYKHTENDNINRLDFFNRNGAVGYRWN